MCNGLGRFELSSILAVHVSNLTFIGCPGNRVERVNKIMLEDSRFIGQDNFHGSALEVVETNAQLIRTTFISNTGKSHSMRRISYPYPNPIASVVAGGAILSTSSNITIEESTFEGNHAGVGGAIFSEFLSNITIINSTFSGNFAQTPEYDTNYLPGGGVLNAVDGGTVIIHDSLFVNNSALGGGGGGVLSAVRQIIIHIGHSRFMNNTAFNRNGKGGGVLYAAESVNISINSSQFVNNYCENGGGVAYVEINVNIIMAYSHFVNNSSPDYGGVLAAEDAVNVTAIYSQFVNNTSVGMSSTGTASYGGGVIHAVHNVNIFLNRSEFVGNACDGGGGVVNAHENVYIVSNDSRFINNSCNGGGVLYNLANVNTSIAHSEFIGNHANKGGVVYCSNSISNSDTDTNIINFLSINQSYFANNTASGGVVAVEYSFKLIIGSSQFISNSALGIRANGGVVWAKATVSVDISHSNFTNNSATDRSSGFEVPPGELEGAYYGGGVLYAVFQVNVTITCSHFIGNRATRGNGGVIFSSGYLYGSNILNYGHGVVTISNSLFDSNYALGVQGGGAIFAVSNITKHISVHNNTFVNNSAVYGGVMLAIGNVNITANGNFFVDNSARNGGVLAALARTSSNNIQFVNLYGILKNSIGGNTPGNICVHVNQSEFSNNKAVGGYGGGVVFAGSGVNMTLAHSQFVNNSALGTKGGVLWLTDNALKVVFSSFKNNSASNGGTMYVYVGSIVITNSSFDFNSASGKGGVFNMDQSHIKIDGTVLNGNTAGANGGIMYTLSTVMVINASRFYDNRASHDGGAILSSDGRMTVLRSAFGNNTAGHSGGAMALWMGTLTINEGVFVSNLAGKDGGAIQIYQGNMDTSDSAYRGNLAMNDGGVINAFESSSRISGCSFTNNLAINDGGAINAYQGILVISEGTAFSYNTAQNDGGVVHAYEVDTAVIIGNSCHNNRADNRGGVWFVYQGNLAISQSIVSHSRAADGGVLYADQVNTTVANTSCVQNKAEEGGALHTLQGTISISHTSFSQNSVTNVGGAWVMEGCRGVLEEVSFAENFANNGGALYSINSSVLLIAGIFKQNLAGNAGGAIYSSQSKVKTFKTLLVKNNRANLGVVYLLGSMAHLHGHTFVSNNSGSFLVFNSMITFTGTTRFVGGSEPAKSHDTNVALREGGALTASKSDIVFNGTVSLTDNHAENGGALHATESKVYVFSETTTVAFNRANNTGGGVYLYMSELQCQGTSILNISSNFAAQKGGGIHAISSSINVVGNFTYNSSSDEYTYMYVGSLLHFDNNEAEKGGGLCLEMTSKLYVLKATPNEEPFPIVTFSVNSADYGGAVYVSDESNLGMCNPTFSSHYKAKECFFQVLASYSSFPYKFENTNANIQNIFFSDNHANSSGSSLFGGLIDRCKLQHFSEFQNFSSLTTSKLPQHKPQDAIIVNGISYITNISNVRLLDVSSEPVQLCFCKDHKPDCTYQPDPIRVIKGKIFSVSVVAVDQVNHLINANVHSLLLRTGGGLRSGQEIQNVSDVCTELHFNLFSPNDKEELVMYAEGPCEGSPQSQRQLTIQFTACDSCPIGFQRHVDEDTSCQCICDTRLEPYITKCNSSTELLEREGNFWITYVNGSDNTTNGYLIYAHCPFNYCKPPTMKVEINLNMPSGADVQCANGHSGMLCGSCQSSFSLSLGSSRCIPCSSIHWPTFVLVLIAPVLGGVCLVVLLLVLNLTVAVGTLNGIIFYANIVASSNSTFLPFLKPNFVTVFVAWLNLEIAFDTCFFQGMDAYWKTFLELVFPVYVIFLVVMVIFISERSTKFARLVAKRNPIATLATLILLSYTKFLNTIIASLSYATLIYPDGSYRRVWLPDASVEYLKGKHIVLFVVAVLILAAGIVYTGLLFFWQWLLRHQDRRILKWMRYQKLCHFIEPYHAPYTFEQRYWTGLLLFVRVILYVISAVNLTGDPQVSLVSTVVLVGLLPLLKAILEKKIYKQWPVDAMEMIMYFNIITFAVVTLKTGTTEKQIIVAYVSISLTFTFLMAIIAYHLFHHAGLYSGIKKITNFISKKVKCRNNHRFRSATVPSNDEDDQPLITHSIVEIPSTDLPLEVQQVEAVLDPEEEEEETSEPLSPRLVFEDVNITATDTETSSKSQY